MWRCLLRNNAHFELEIAIARVLAVSTNFRVATPDRLHTLAASIIMFRAPLHARSVRRFLLGDVLYRMFHFQMGVLDSIE